MLSFSADNFFENFSEEVFFNSSCEFDGEIESTIEVYQGAERYSGDYEVTPNFDTQTLETENKLMTDDVTVFPIPVHRTTNPYGTTVYIGGLLGG